MITMEEALETLREYEREGIVSDIRWSKSPYGSKSLTYKVKGVLVNTIEGRFPNGTFAYSTFPIHDDETRDYRAMCYGHYNGCDFDSAILEIAEGKHVEK